MTLVVAEALSPNKPNKPKQGDGQTILHIVNLLLYYRCIYHRLLLLKSYGPFVWTLQRGISFGHSHDSERYAASLKLLVVWLCIGTIWVGYPIIKCSTCIFIVVRRGQCSGPSLCLKTLVLIFIEGWYLGLLSPLILSAKYSEITW